MGTTIIKSWATNEGPDGALQSGPSFLARPETPAEAAETRAVGDAFFSQTGFEPRKARIDFFGNDHARVHLNGRAYLLDKAGGSWVVRRK